MWISAVSSPDHLLVPPILRFSFPPGFLSPFLMHKVRCRKPSATQIYTLTNTLDWIVFRFKYNLHENELDAAHVFLFMLVAQHYYHYFPHVTIYILRSFSLLLLFDRQGLYCSIENEMLVKVLVEDAYRT